MTKRIDDATRAAVLDAIEASIGTAPVLTLRTGAPPTLLTDADTGTLLATIALPADWMAGAVAGSKAKSGTWSVAGDDDRLIAARGA